MLIRYKLFLCLSFTSLLTVCAASWASSSSATIAGGQTESCQLNILLTNDDGWEAPGIQSLFRSLQRSGHNVTMVAPLTQQSGRSSAINSAVGSPVSIKQQSEKMWSVDGTPADSIKAALGIVLQDSQPDLVISGANFGPNVGQQTVLNSGTLGASLTAQQSGLPAIAVSVGIDVTERNTNPAYKSTIAGFKSAQKALDLMLNKLITQNGCGSPLAGNHILSMNIPVPVEEIRGIRYAPLSPNELFHLTWQRENEVNRISYTRAGKAAASQNDDVGYFLRKFITVTPISGDLTARDLFNKQKSDKKDHAESGWLPNLAELAIDK